MGLLLGFVVAAPTAAQTIVTVDFDALDTSGGFVTGAALDAYLAGFANPITLTNVTATFTPLVVVNFATALTALGPNNVVAPSQPNILEQFGGPATSFTLEFATPLISFSFTRAGRCTPLAFPPWTAVAKDSSAATLSTVSEGRGSTGASCFAPTPAVGFTLSGPDIKSVTFTSGNFGFFGRSSPAIDDMVLTFITPITPGITKEITSGLDVDLDGNLDVVVEVGQTQTTPYDFTITYSNPGGPDVLIVDTTPAEWVVTEIEGDATGNGPDPLPVSPRDLANFDDGEGGSVDVSKTGKGAKSKSATRLEWTPDPNAVSSDIRVDVETRVNPGHGKRGIDFFSPTSCGKLTLNDGAVAFEIDEFGEIVLDQNGDPVIVQINGEDAITDGLMLVAVSDVNGDGAIDRTGAGDEDGDGLTDLDEAFNVGTDPCNPDTDGDGAPDGADADPLDPEVQ